MATCDLGDCDHAVSCKHIGHLLGKGLGVIGCSFSVKTTISAVAVSVVCWCWGSGVAGSCTAGIWFTDSGIPDSGCQFGRGGGANLAGVGVGSAL